MIAMHFKPVLCLLIVIVIMNPWGGGDGRKFRNYVKYNAVFTAIMIAITVTLIVIHEWNLMFLIGMFAVVLIGIIRLLCSPCQVAFMNTDEKCYRDDCRFYTLYRTS